MKLITAIIKVEQLDKVREALVDENVTRITISRVTGHGQQVGEELYRGKKVVPNLMPKVRLDIACKDDFVETICKTIVKAAKKGKGQIGDGKIFITPLEECIRIRTEEIGPEAV